ncbi:hypothetical protein ACFP1Z_26555 [Streptomyces gamaensis]|uniref:DUF11 domain-containing protein n=1 Tax=Streptomyces gamaensis TaxID=1763542 RepID=A0ABW0Z4R2_9ACTN
MGVQRVLWQAVAALAVVTAAGPAPAAVAAPAGPRSVDYQAVAHPVVGRLGETVEVELGIRNGGPDRADGAGAYEVTPPPGTTITTLPAARDGRRACAPKPAAARSYLCATGAGFPAGDSETLRFRVRIEEKVEGAEGWVRVVGRAGAGPDPDPENDSAPIRVRITEPGEADGSRPGPGRALLLATASGTALSVGAIAFGAMGRRVR